MKYMDTRVKRVGIYAGNVISVRDADRESGGYDASRGGDAAECGSDCGGEKADYLVEQMQQGKDVALVSDAGTPAISDPGEVLVQKCQTAGITVTSLPGPSACITALTLSGLSARRFCFEGFLPPDKKEKAQILAELKEESRTILIYEAPHHLVRTLGELYEALGERRITLCRELTKKFESVLPTTLGEALSLYEREEPRGEYVLVVEGKSLRQKEEERQASWQSMTIEEHMAFYEEGGMDEKAAMKQVAKDRGVPKREIYAVIHGSGMH